MKIKTAHSENAKPVLTSGMFSSRTNEWATPQQFFDRLDEEFGFDLDVAATPENAKCDKFFTEKQDGLEQDWHENSESKAVFCNPPFGGQTGLWVEKAFNESQKGCTVVVVIPFRSDTSYLHDFAFNKAHEIRLVRGRLKYNDGDTASPFPTAVIIFKPGIHETTWTTIDKEGEELGAIVKFKPEITFNSSRTYPNGKKAPNGIEIRFGAMRPTVEVREMLKSHGFQFSEKQTLWYAKDNAKSKELAEFLENNEVDADDTQYEKKHFWAKVSTIDFYNKLGNYTEFMMSGEPPRFFRTKKQLESSVSNVKAGLFSGTLRFKKFYNKAVGEENENEQENESEEDGSKKPSSGNELAEKLKSLADGMQKQVDAKINSPISKQRPTARRMRIAAGMREEGYRMRNVQTLLYALAEAHKTGTIKKYHLLAEIKKRSQAELILLYEDPYGREQEDNYLQRTFDNQRQDFDNIGISNFPKWTAAIHQKNNLIEKTSGSVPKADEQAEKIRELEMQIKSMKIPGFFPTPKNLIEQMIELAELKKEDAILEPSAGKGDILDAIREYFGDDEGDLDAIEMNSNLREILELKGYNVIASDFISYEETAYDKILMNPPFENGQDVDHVMHAYDLLKHGGRLVAIMSEGPFFRQFKKDENFREWLSENNAFVSEPIKGAFKNSFNSTGVNVRIVAINEDSTHPDVDFEKEKDMEEENTEDTESLELEAQAEIELLKMKLELQKRKKGLNGMEELEGINDDKLTRFKLKAMALDFPEVWDFK